MGIRADLLKFYFEVEARYYSFCDWLEKQSVPVYEYFITPVENAGWPSFPVAFGLLLVLIAAVAFSLSSLSIVPSGENAVYIVVLGNNHEPVEGALVELVATGNLVVASGATNATGEVYFADRQNALQVKITHSDFETLMRALRPSLNLQLTSKTISQLNSEPPSRGNEQLGFIGDFSNLVQISQFGSFEVSLASGEVLLNGTMRVFDADTDTMLREAQVVGGVAVFENLPLNQHVYFHGISRGFTVNRTLDFIVSRNSQTVEIQATPVQEANATISVVSSLTRQPLQGAEVKLYREDNVFMYNGSTSSRGNVSFEMSTDVRYYVTVKKQNFLTAVSTFFVPVQGVTVELTPADVNSSSTLRVFFQDEYSEPLQGIATLYTSDNQIIEQSRVSQTVQDFRNLQRGLSVVVKGTSGELTSRKNVTLLEAVHEEVLQMEVRFAFLSLSAVDALTRATIVSDVNVTVMRDGSLLSTCTAPCVARVKTRGVYFINFSSIGYFNYVVQYGLRGQSLQTFQEATTTEVNASMMPVESVRDSQILLNGVFDAFTFQPITAGNALVQNRVYLASVSTYFANATIGGTFFTVSSGNNFGSILSFTPYPDEDDAPIGLDVRGSNDPDGRQCGSALNGERWKRVVLQQPLNPTSLTGQHYQFFFVPEVGQYSNITLSYKSFVNNTNRAVIRNPFDSNLGTNAVQYNGANSECSAQTYKTSFAVISPNEASNQLGSIKLNLRQTRNFSLVERVNAIESCGAITGTGTQQSDYASFDCNGFTVDSGQPNPLEVNALIRLNYAARGGKIRFTANQDYFALVNSSFNVSNRPPQVFHDGESPVFEQVIPSELFGVQGSREIYATVKLTAVGFTSSTEINAEFVPSEADALMLNSSNNTLAKSLFVTVNQLTIPRSVSLLSRFSCGNQTSVNFSYDDGLLPSGSGWIGCNQIPMIVDPVFPADAIPIYVENATSSRDCAAPGSGGALVSKAKLELGVESRPSPNGQPCFDLLDESDSRLAGGVLKHVEGYDGYVLRFNSVACGGVHGNDVSLSNVTLKLSCEGRATATGPIDTKTVNVTVFKQGGEWLKNLVAARFKTTTTLNSFSNNSRVTYFYAPSNGTCPFGWPVIARINLNHPTNFTIEEINGRSTSIWGIAENKIGLTGYFQANARIFVNNASAISNQAANYRAGQILPRAIDLFDRDSDYSYLLRKKIPRYLPLPSSTVPSVGVGAFYCAVHTDQPLQPIYGMDNEDNYAFAFIEKAPQPIELNPELYVLIDNLQIRTPENRDLGVTLWPLSGSLIPINLEDQPARAFGVAIRNEFWPNTGDFWLTENNVALGLDFPDDDLSQPLPSSFSETGKPFLEYVEDADAMRLASAFRRSPSSYTTTRYWCLANRDPSPDSAVCRPTLNDWTSTVQSVAVETRSCNICQNGVNCDATCNAETHKKPDGTPCFNSCTAPLCYSAIQCNPETHTRQVDVLGRHTLTWLNSSPLVPAVLYAANGDENARDAPFKFFSDFTSGSFKYTMATLVKQQCADSNSRDSFGKSDTCFSDQGTMAKLSQFGPVPEGVMNQWFGNPNPSSQDFGSLKLSEEQGGCSQSARWDRGYYAVTFTYEKDSDDVQGNSWKWSYAAEPLEVSSNYGQLNTETDLKSCRVTSLTGGRNTKLCYAIFATNVTNEAGKPGQCIRSLRDYIPLIPDAENNLNIIRADKLAPLQTEPVEYIGALKQQIPTGGIYLRDMDVQLGKAKCNFFDDIPANVVQTTCVGGNDCFLPLPLSLIMGGPFFPVADFNASTVGITQGGKADWITEFKQDDRAADQKCYDAFHISGVPNPLRWTGDGSDMSYSLRYSGRGVDGSALQISENSDNMCFAACRIVCSTYPYC